MFKLKNLKPLVIAMFSSAVLFSNVAFADEVKTHPPMTPPPALENKVFDAMVGTWTGESDMMGTKMRETMEIRWGINHQFLIMDLKAQDINNPSMVYEGKGIFGVDKNGQAKTWWFDSWGAQAATTGTGKFSDNKLELQDSNAMFKEKRTFTIDSPNNQMTMTAKGSVKINGKTQTFDQTTVYKKSY